jgi:hypothetical protein
MTTRLTRRAFLAGQSPVEHEPLRVGPHGQGDQYPARASGVPNMDWGIPPVHKDIPSIFGPRSRFRHSSKSSRKRPTSGDTASFDSGPPRNSGAMRPAGMGYS